MIDTAPAHKFYAAVRRAANRVGLGDFVPEFLLRIGLPGLMTRLSVDPPVPMDPSLLRAQKLYHTLVFEHAETLSVAFRSRDIEHFFAKGVALVGWVYQPGDRFLGDIDLYIPFPARDTAISTLRELGYAPLPEPEQSGPPELRSALAFEYATERQIEQIGVDLHWALDPVERLLPRREREIPRRVWDVVVSTGTLNVPFPEHHAAILAHHLIHTDLIHIRSLLDLAFVFQQFSTDGGAEFLATCQQLRLGGFGVTLARILDQDFGIRRAEAQRPVGGENRFNRQLNLERWLMLVAGADPDDDNRITLGRIRRRLRVLDHRNIRTLVADVVVPPAAFLSWRWGKPFWRARLMHVGQLVRKLTPMMR